MDIETNIIYCGDCLKQLEKIPNESIDLIYIDPPFSSNRNYVAFWQEQEKRHFEDRFENVRAYLDYMKPRVEQLYRTLKPTGSFYYHCDWHASHYIKILLDRDDLFGYNNFRNEIVWRRSPFVGSSKSRARFFPRNHDVILVYSKTDAYTFIPIMIPYTEEYKQRRFKNPDNDPKGAWQSVLLKTYSQATLDRLRAEGALLEGGNRLRYKFYLKDSMRTRPQDDVWADRETQQINPFAKERLGYPTQKPEGLLERIIKASSNEGDIVLDAFCGCGTTLIEAQSLRRTWIGIDISPTACRVMAKRLENTFYLKEGKDFWVRDLPKTAEELRQYPPFEFQNWAINAIGGVPSKAKVRDGGIDGKLYPIEDIKKERTEGLDLFGDIDRYIPIQTKRTEQVGRPDIENFEVAMKRDKRNKGIFVGFTFSRDAEVEIRRAKRDDDLEIEAITVAQIVEQQLDKQLK